VTLLLGESLNGFEGKTVLRNIQTKSGNRVAAGLAVVACGAEPNLDLVRNTLYPGHTVPRSTIIWRPKRKEFTQLVTWRFILTV
jgi:hypothetical protein